jgi:hypothetical protein
MTNSEAPLPVAVEAATADKSDAPMSPIVTPQPDELASNHSTPRKNTTPRKHVDSKPLPTDSLITIPLSDTTDRMTMNSDGAVFEYSPSIRSQSEEAESWQDSDSKSEEMGVGTGRGSGESELEMLAHEIENYSGSISSATKLVEDRSRSGSTSSNGSVQLDWDSLDQTEAREDADTDSDEVSQIFLIADYFF